MTTRGSTIAQLNATGDHANVPLSVLADVNTTRTASYVEIGDIGSAGNRFKINSAGNVGVGVTSIPSWANLMTDGTVAVGGILYMKTANAIQALSNYPGGASDLKMQTSGGKVTIGGPGGSTTGHLELYGRYSGNDPKLSFRSDHPTSGNNTVWDMARITADDGGNYNGVLHFQVAAGNGSEKSVCEGIRWAVDKGRADFICMSLGAPNPVSGVEKALKYATSKGVVSFVAAGNSGNTKKVFYPANYPETIAIGSIDENKRRSHFSNTGHNLDFMAPGNKILSTVPDDWYAVLSGTSMATPFMVGIAALLLSYSRANGNEMQLRTKADYVKVFKQHTFPIKNEKMKNNRFYEGFGIVDPKKLFESLKSFMLELML